MRRRNSSAVSPTSNSAPSVQLSSGFPGVSVSAGDLEASFNITAMLETCIKLTFLLFVEKFLSVEFEVYVFGMFFVCVFFTLCYPFREIWAALPS